MIDLIDDPDLPEPLRLRAALSVSVLALRMIAERRVDGDGATAARVALKLLRTKHPIVEEHLPSSYLHLTQ